MSNTKRTRTDYGISALEFSLIWERSENTEAANKALTELSRSRGKIGADQVVKKNVMLSRASALRAKGGKLKLMERAGHRKTDINEINAQLAALAKSVEAPAVSV